MDRSLLKIWGSFERITIRLVEAFEGSRDVDLRVKSVVKRVVGGGRDRFCWEICGF